MVMSRQAITVTDLWVSICGQKSLNHLRLILLCVASLNERGIVVLVGVLFVDISAVKDELVNDIEVTQFDSVRESRGALIESLE
jgi:hypothetical protein